jgi:hypothetical protein
VPVKLADLRPGDRVILNCPKSKVATHRQAEFIGVFKTLGEALDKEPGTALLVDVGTLEFIKSGKGGLWAGFVFQTSSDPTVRIRRGDGTYDEFLNPTGRMEMRGAYVVEADGSLREEEGRRIFIERRVGRVERG